MRITNTLLLGLALCASTPAFAGTWDGAYDGTIVSTYTDGRVVNVYVNADHTYSIKTTAGALILSGTWADGADGSCFTQTSPAPAAGAKPLCFPVKDYKVGDSFTGSDPSGSFTGVVKAGR